MFDKVLGHESIKQYLKKQIECEEVSHAYTFYGINSIGKKMLAMEFAKELLETELLNACPDFKYIEKSDQKTEIVVEQIKKQITEDVNITPACSKHKVYIINDAEQMNVSAQNKLLKTLEEPPRFVVIILVTSFFEKLLPTIKSRTSNINFNRICDSDIEKIAGFNISSSLLKYSEGSLNKILQSKEESVKEKYEIIEKIAQSIKNKDKYEVVQGLKNISIKDEALDYLEYLLLKQGNYSAISKIEGARVKVQDNANDEIMATVLAIELCK